MSSQVEHPATERNARSADTCVGCGGQSLIARRRYRTKTSHGKAIFENSSLRECPTCGLVQTCPSPSLDALESYYAREYRNGCFAGADVADLSKFPLDNLFYFNRGHSIAELVAPMVRTEAPRILDIGAGYGHILAALGALYPAGRRTAIEMSDQCVQHLRSLGTTVHAAPAEQILPRLEERFDIIVLSHVLEHLLDPAAMLRVIHQRLAPGGVLYVEVPHIPSIAMNGYIDSVWAPRFDEPHITFFTPTALRNLIGSCGYGVPFCETAGLMYKQISALQFHLPHWRWFLQKAMPSSLFHFLRARSFTQPLKVKVREESFYQYGGNRIWIRAIAQK